MNKVYVSSSWKKFYLQTLRNSPERVEHILIADGHLQSENYHDISQLTLNILRIEADQ